MTRPETPENPRLEPCFAVNPALWDYFCALANRDAGPSHVWTEADVVQWLDEKDWARRRNATYRLFSGILSEAELNGLKRL